MGGFFGIASKRDALADVFFGTDYHSHLGTRRAGVADSIKIFEADARRISAPGRRGTVVTNPPYGERLLSSAEIVPLYRSLGEHFRSLAPWQIYVISSSRDFERLYGKRADKIRKLYNGMIPCYLYQYFKNEKGCHI